jgi:hypothetical protein
MTRRAFRIWIGLAVILAIGAFDILYLRRNFVNHDVHALMSLAERILDGLSVNDPLAPREMPFTVFVYMLPVLLHRALPIIDPELAAILLTCAAAVGSTLLCRHIAAAAKLWRSTAGLDAAMAFLFAGFTLQPIFLAQNSFAVREHLLIILCAPYFFVCMAYLNGAAIGLRTLVAAGMMGAIGFLDKPILSLLFLVSEAYLMLRTKRVTSWVRADALIIGLSGLAYMVLWPTLYRVYFTDMGFYTQAVLNLQPFSNMVFPLGFVLVWGGAIILYVVIFLRRECPRPLEYTVLLLACAIGLFVLQRRSFVHLFYLPLAFIMLLCTVAIGRRSLFHGGMLVVIYLVPFNPIGMFHRLDDHAMADDMKLAATKLQSYIEGRRVSVVSMTVLPVWPILTQAGAAFDGPVKNLPSVENLLKRYGTLRIDDSKLNDGELYFRGLVARYVKERRPEWVLVVTMDHPGYSERVDVLSHLAGEPGFSEAWSDYRPVLTEHDVPSIRNVYHLSLYKRADDR